MSLAEPFIRLHRDDLCNTYPVEVVGRLDLNGSLDRNFGSPDRALAYAEKLERSYRWRIVDLTDTAQ